MIFLSFGQIMFVYLKLNHLYINIKDSNLFKKKTTIARLTPIKNFNIYLPQSRR